MEEHRRRLGHRRPGRRPGDACRARALALVVVLAAAAPAAVAQAQPVGRPRQSDAVHAQAPLTDVLVRAAFAAADRRDYAFAERLTARLLSGGLARDSWTRGEALRCQGLVGLAAGRFGEAAAALAEAEALFDASGAVREQALTWRLQARVAIQDGNRGHARALLDRALHVFEARGDDPEVVATLSVLASVLERADEGPNVLARALALAERIGDAGQYARLLHTDGDWRFGAGDFAGAARSYQRAEALYVSAQDDEGLGRVWTSLGRLNRAHGRHEEALAYYRRAHGALARAGDQQGVIQAVNATATALSNLGRDEEARVEYERALDLALRSGSSRIINFQRGNLGGFHLGEGDFERAIPLLRESADHESSPTTRAIRLTQLGRAYAGAGRLDEALATYDQAVARLRELGNRERLFSVLAFRAEAFRRLKRSDQALADVRESLEILEQVRHQLAPGDFLRRGFHQSTQDYASHAIGILVEAGRAREALEVAERARARAFLDLLAVRPRLAAVKEDPGAPGAGHGATPSIADALLLTRDRPAEAGAAATTAPLAESGAAASVDQILDEARARRSTLLSYWVDPDATHVWAVRPDGVVRHASVTVNNRRLAALVRALWAGLPAPVPGVLETQLTSRAAPGPAAPGDEGAGEPERLLSPRGAARELYRLLVAPVAAALPGEGATLTIVPHGPLFRLSFAALLDERERYLVERYAVAYGPSASVLAFTRAMAGRQLADEAHHLLVANPTPMPAAPGSAGPLPPLPGTLDEVGQIAARLPAAAVTTLTGAAATETAVTRALAQATTIHLATHGIVRDDDPFGSFLALGATGGDASADGALTAEEIYGLRLRARLVVLSACRSGLGEVSADGIVGLTRAFFFAGAPRVVATLWDVADGPSARVLRAFYAALGRDQDVARALRTAQLTALADLRAGRLRDDAAGARLPERPVFWASFVLMGEP